MIGDYWNKQDNEQKNTDVSLVKESASGSKNGLLGCNLNSYSNFHMENSLVCSDFSSTSNAIELVEGSFGNKHQPIPSTIVNDFKDSFCSSNESNNTLTELCQSGDILDSSNPSSCKETYEFLIDGRKELDGKSSAFFSDHDHNALDNFLDWDWGSITEFDDFDRIFRWWITLNLIFSLFVDYHFRFFVYWIGYSCRNSSSIFEHEMMKDVDSSQAEATPLPIHVSNSMKNMIY